MGLQLKLNSDSTDFASELSIPLPPTESFNKASVTLRVKAELGPQKDNSPIEHRVCNYYIFTFLSVDSSTVINDLYFICSLYR